MTPSQINKKYAARAARILESIRAILIHEGYSVDAPIDMSDEDFRLSMVVLPDLTAGREEVDISLTIANSELWDGSKGGVNFMVDIVGESGQILGGCCPYNYTSDVWVPRKDPAGIEARFKLLEDAAPDSAVDCLTRAWVSAPLDT